jgi:predicted esterase
VAANPHLDDAPVLAGAALSEARAAAVVLHGRAQEPAYMLEHLVGRLAAPGVAYVLPAAAGNSWYPERYFDPREANEPWLGHALDACEACVQTVLSAGVPAERLVLAGFSQGACLVVDAVVRRPRPYGGVAILTGAFIGDVGDAPPPLDGLPAAFVSSAHDDWVAIDDVRATAAAFEAAGARVTLEVTDEREHVIGDEAVRGVERLLRAASG